MPEMIRYIFKNLHVNENAIENIQKTLRVQSNLNRSLVIFSIMTTANIIVLSKRVNKLEEELKKLKREEGE